MFAVPFNRMFWKEYRAQRALFFSCLLIGIVTQITLGFTALHPEIRSDFLLGAASFFPVMYAVGCGALLFASEREDRTADWLVSLSIPPAPSLAAKVAFAVVSVVGLQSVLALFSLVLLGGASGENLRTMFLPFALVVLIWSSLGSLLSQRVLMSVPLTFLLGLVSHLLLLYVLVSWHQQSFRMNTPVVFIAVGVLSFCALGVDFWLGLRWCQGQYFDGSSIENVQFRLTDFWQSQSKSRKTTSRLTTRVEPEQAWYRTWQRLVWQERNRESLHWSMLIGGISLSLLMAWSGRRGLSDPSTRDAVAILVIGLVSLIPFSMGVLGFRSDTSRSQSRFLAFRGISPASIWMSKQVVWLFRAFSLPIAVIAFARCCEALFAWDYVMGHRPMASIVSTVISHPWLVVWGVLASYGSGQLGALLFQRTILAIAFGVMLNVVLMGWFGLIEVLSVPQWWSLGLPVLAMFSITLWQMRPWLHEDNSWSRKWKIAVALIGTPSLIVMLLACFRVAEAATFPPIDQSLVWQFQSTRTVSRPPTAEQESVRLRLEQLSHSDDAGQGVADEIVELLKREHISLEPQYGYEGSVHAYANKIKDTLDRQADAYLDKGVLDKSLDCHLADLRLGRFLSRGSNVYGWWSGSIFQYYTLESLVTWANHPSQTSDSIRTALKSIEAELTRFPSATEGIVATYDRDRRTWISSSRTEIIEELTRLKIWENDSAAGMTIFPALLPWERKRADLLMTRDAEFQFAAIWSLEHQLQSPKSNAHESLTKTIEASELIINHLKNTTFFLRFSANTLRFSVQAVLDRHTTIRAALTRMELIAYRLEHGQLPDRLVQLIPNFNGVNLVDPYSGRLFEYYPTFLLSSGLRGVELVPTDAKNLEFHWNGSTSTNKQLTFNQLVNGTPQESLSRLTELRKEGDLGRSLFLIPRQGNNR
ncbi:MAG: hypothetical protein WCH39_14725 [Schlesneria sp.]